MFNDLLKDLSYYINVGGFVMPPLLLASIVLWWAIGYRWSALKRGTSKSVRALLRKPKKRIKKEPGGIVEAALQEGLLLKKSGKSHLRRRLDDAFWSYEADIKKHRTLINTIVAIAPLMGLLGTVVGMIETFESLGNMSLFSQSGGIAGGISQALFTTQMGLAVSIPGLLVSGMLNRRQTEIETDLAQIKDMLCSDDPLLEGKL